MFLRLSALQSGTIRWVSFIIWFCQGDGLVIENISHEFHDAILTNNNLTEISSYGGKAPLPSILTLKSLHIDSAFLTPPSLSMFVR